MSSHGDTTSPAFYEERLRLLEAENQRLRDALEEIADNPYGDTDLAFVRGQARVALDGTPGEGSSE